MFSMISIVTRVVRFVCEMFVETRRRQVYTRQLGFERVEGRYCLSAGGLSDCGELVASQNVAVEQATQPVVINKADSVAKAAAACGSNYLVTPLIDFNGDNHITALDVLTVIDRMNRHGGVFALRPMSGDLFDLMDPDGDGKCSPMHALIAISWLNQHGSGPFIQYYTDVVFEQYTDDPIVVVPSQQHALVAQATFTASVYNINPVFLSRVTAEGDSDVIQLQYTDSRYGQTWSTTWGSYKDLWLPDIQLDPGVSIQVSMYADIRPNASGELKFGLSNLQARAFPGEVVEFVPDVNKPVIVKQPEFTVSVDSSSPVSQIVAGDQQVVAGKFKVTTTASDYVVQEARFTVPSGSSAVIVNASLVDGTTVLGTVPFDNNSGVFCFTGLNFVVPANTAKVLTVQYALATPSADCGTSGLNVAPTLSYVRAFDCRGLVTELAPLGVTANDSHVYKSFPTVTGVATPVLPINVGASVGLYSWCITADPSGDVSVKQIELAIVWNDNSNDSQLGLRDFHLFKNGVDITSTLSIYDDLGTDLKLVGITEKSSKIIVSWNDEEFIPAGVSNVFLVKAVPSGFRVAPMPDDSISIRLIADGTSSPVKFINQSDEIGRIDLVSSTGSGPKSASFIWSDQSSIAHSCVVEKTGLKPKSSGDWADGFRVSGLVDLEWVNWSA